MAVMFSLTEAAPPEASLDEPATAVEKSRLAAPRGRSPRWRESSRSVAMMVEAWLAWDREGEGWLTSPALLLEYGDVGASMVVDELPSTTGSAWLGLDRASSHCVEVQRVSATETPRGPHLLRVEFAASD
jgi:hypothetical protein